MSRITTFQRSVYGRLLEIPYGHVVSYGKVATDLGQDVAAARAVGQAVGSNPVPIMVPCHRVVGSDGQLSGYGGGLDRKAALWRLEGIEVDGARPTSRVHPEAIGLPL